VSPFNDCLYIFKPEAFNQWVYSLFESKGGFNPIEKQDVDMRAVLMSRGVYVEAGIDNRITIPESFCRTAGISS